MSDYSLEVKHVQNCKMLLNRYFIYNYIPQNGVGVEIGVLGGDWSNHLLAYYKPSELVLIDTFCSNDYAHQNRFTKKTHEEYIRNHFKSYGNQVKIEKGLSWECMRKFPDNYFDWIYIDAAHDYDSVKKDLKEAYRTLKPNGHIILNDYIMYDHITNEVYGVVQATNEFLVEYNFEMLYYALHPSMFCDVVIKQIQG